MDDLYLELRERLDHMGIGFPSVPGKDVAYLKLMFTEDQAKVFVAMEHRLQPIEEIAERLGRSPEELEPILEEMGKKAYVMTTRKITPTFYAPVPWLSGWGDFSGYYIDREAALAEKEYREEAEFKGPGPSFKRNVFRTIPVHQTIENKSGVASYDDLRTIVEQDGSIAVSDCYCDRLRIARGEKGYEPLERCFAFGKSAEFVVSKNFGRLISSDEAMDILQKCADSGLVPNVGDRRLPYFICNCGEHCGGNISRKGKPPWQFEEYEKTSNYYTTVDADACTGCEVCIDRCWFDALSMGPEGVVEIDSEICEGCGLCITECLVEALELQARDESEHYIPVFEHPNMRHPEEYKKDLEPYKDIIKFG